MTATQHLSVIKLLRLLLNVISTALTLITLQENVVLTSITGRYDAIRQRLRDGSISTEISEGEFFRLQDLATPQQLADYTMITTPRRDPNSIGEYRSVCTNINTNAAPMMISYNDDFWGRNARRVQIYVYSISAPYCELINVKPSWRDACVASHSGNATACYRSILTNFDTLRNNRTIRQQAVKDFGVKGVPLMRCLGRPFVPFSFKADLLAHQTYWNGGAYHLTIQTSLCRGAPLARADDLQYTLFQSENVDEGAEMLVLLPPDGWFTFLVSRLHSVVTLVMIAHGVFLALFHSRVVQYLPKGMRFSEGDGNEWLRYLAPFMSAVIFASGNERAVISFKGSLLIASDVWMSHWLYMYLSILEAITNIRLTYVTFQISTSLLLMKVTPVSVLFLLTALVKISWIMCLVQTIVRMLVKSVARCLRALRVIRSSTRERLAHNIDGISMFLTYKVYNLLLIVLVVLLIAIKGDPSFQVRTKPYKVGEYGGIPDIVSFWGSEIACDLFTLLAMLTVLGQCVGLVLFCTKYKHIADNSLMRLLQQRFVISGWDGLMAAEMLGLDVHDPELLVDGSARTKCSVGALLQLLYLSGPSGFVHLGGDYIFHDGGFSKEPVKFKYTVAKAMAMNLFQNGGSSDYSKVNGGATFDSALNRTGAPSTNRPPVQTQDQDVATAPVAKSSIFTRYLRVVSEGYLGKMLLVDATNSGHLVTNKETGTREYEVVDALSTMTILDIKWLLGNAKKLRIE